MIEYLDLLYPKEKLIKLTKTFSLLNINSETQFYDKFYDIYKVDYRIIFRNIYWKKAYYNLLYKYYKNEYVIKRAFTSKKLSDSRIICSMELPILDCRIDLFSVGNHSTAYEIKTEFDKLDRIKKQIKTYSACFEYVYVICSHDKLAKIKKMIGRYVGIYYYNSLSLGKIRFVKDRSAKISPYLSSANILKQFNKNELQLFFKTNDTKKIKKMYSKYQINIAYKQYLRQRYHTKSKIFKNEVKLLY